MSWWRRPLTLSLLALLLVVQAELWLGRGGLAHMLQLRAQVHAAQARNDAAEQVNHQLQAEISDLKDGLEMVEEKARSDLGMVKANEILVQYDARTIAAAAASAPDAQASAP